MRLPPESVCQQIRETGLRDSHPLQKILLIAVYCLLHVIHLMNFQASTESLHLYKHTAFLEFSATSINAHPNNLGWNNSLTAFETEFYHITFPDFLIMIEFREIYRSGQPSFCCICFHYHSLPLVHSESLISIFLYLHFL